MVRASATDGEFRVHLACRRSSRLSPSISSTGEPLSGPALDPEKACSPADGFVSEGASSLETEDCSDLGDCLVESVGGALTVGVELTASEVAMGDAMAVMSGVAQDCVPSSDDLQNTAMGAGGADAYAGSLGEFSVVAITVPPAQPVIPSGVVIPGNCMSVPVLAPHDVILSHTLTPLLVDDLSRNDGGGMVREEGRDPPVAKEAVRPQPADGLRQLPRSSEVSLP
ncbi:hypothetical protein Dimus_003426, partial [Dionaea muscipula]